MILGTLSFTQHQEISNQSAMLDCSPRPILNDNVITLDHYGKEDGYYTFISSETTPQNVRSVVFLAHGYGALNPAIFGAWIEHLLDEGNIIVYPRYQKNLILPGAQKFTPNATRAWKDAVAELASLNYDEYPVVFVGHSFGGVVISNMLVESEESNIRLPDCALVCEGGVGPFTGALAKSYSGISDQIPMVMVVGQRDWTVGATFANKLFQEIPGHSESFYVFQKAGKLPSGRTITASHYEPYSIDKWCDNGMDNFTYRRAQQVGKLDEMNYNGYWYWLDLLIEKARDPNQITITEEKLRASMRRAIPSLADSILEMVSKDQVLQLSAG